MPDSGYAYNATSVRPDLDSTQQIQRHIQSAFDDSNRDHTVHAGCSCEALDSRHQQEACGERCTIDYCHGSGVIQSMQVAFNEVPKSLDWCTGSAVRQWNSAAAVATAAVYIPFRIGVEHYVDYKYTGSQVSLT